MAVNTAVEKPHPPGVFVLISLLFYHMYMAHNSFILLFEYEPNNLGEKEKKKEREKKMDRGK